MNPNDIAGRAQADYYKNAIAQANAPVRGAVNPKPNIPQWLSQLPSTPAIEPVGGLFEQPIGMPTAPQLGGLMDFNSLAMQLAGGQPQGPTMQNLFNSFINPGQFLFPSRRNPIANIGVRG